jgi:hypothetical protein
MSFKHMKNTYFLINYIKKACEKNVLLGGKKSHDKRHVILNCKSFYHPICKKFLSTLGRAEITFDTLLLLCLTSFNRSPITMRRENCCGSGLTEPWLFL